MTSPIFVVTSHIFPPFFFLHVFSSPPAGGFYLHTPSVSAEKTWSAGSKTMNVIELPNWIELDSLRLNSNLKNNIFLFHKITKNSDFHRQDEQIHQQLQQIAGFLKAWRRTGAWWWPIFNWRPRRPRRPRTWDPTSSWWHLGRWKLYIITSWHFCWFLYHEKILSRFMAAKNNEWLF